MGPKFIQTTIEVSTNRVTHDLVSFCQSTGCELCPGTEDMFADESDIDESLFEVNFMDISF